MSKGFPSPWPPPDRPGLPPTGNETKWSDRIGLAALVLLVCGGLTTIVLLAR